GRGIADAPIEQIQFGIVGTGHPGGAAAVFPTVTGPGFMAFFAGTGNGPEAPGAVTGRDVESGQVAAVRGIPAGDADDDFILDEERRTGDIAAALALVLDIDTP